MELRTPEAVRAAAERAFALAEAGGTGFTLRMEAMPALAARVAATIRRRHPELRVPYHARWRHFGGRVGAGDLPPHSAFDLVITSVLLDAGAGMAWRYRSAEGEVLSRSEGLGVASWEMFAAGGFSATAGEPLRADAEALAAVTEAQLARGFQVTADNPLVGLDGRAALLRRLGSVCADLPGERPGGLFDLLTARRDDVTARDILIALLRHLGPVWPRVEGDVWQHPVLGTVPFHKLSQWLAYSLIEPLEAAGFPVAGLGALTGLPEYRNGGLFLDGGVLELRDPADAARTHAAGDPLIIEWRALTVALLDRIVPMVADALGVAGLPLARVLEGGTWFAGRELAAERRADGGSPLRVESDGTVF
jgi:hypothetical protein